MTQRQAKQVAKAIRELINARLLNCDITKETMREYSERKIALMDECESKIVSALCNPHP